MSFENMIRTKLLPEHTYHLFNRGNQGYNIFFSDENFRFFLRRYRDFMGPFVDTLAYCLLPNHFHLVIQVKPAEEIFTAWDNRLIRRRGDWVKAGELQDRNAQAYLQAAQAQWEADSSSGGILPEQETPQGAKTTVAEAKTAGSVGKHERGKGHDKSPGEEAMKEEGLVRAGDARARHVMSCRHDMSESNSNPTYHLRTHTAAELVAQRFRHFMISYAKALNNERRTYGTLFQRAFRRKLIKEGEGLKRVVAYVHFNGFRHGLAKSMQDYPWTSWHELSPPEHSVIIAADKTLELYGGEQAFRAYHQFPPLALDPRLEDLQPDYKPAA